MIQATMVITIGVPLNSPTKGNGRLQIPITLIPGFVSMFFLSHCFVIPLLELTIRKFLGNCLIINPFPSTYAFLSDLKTWSLLVMSTSAIDVANYKRDFGLRDRRKGVGITVGNI